MAIFSRWSWVSRYQNVSILDFIGAEDVNQHIHAVTLISALYEFFSWSTGTFIGQVSLPYTGNKHLLSMCSKHVGKHVTTLIIYLVLLITVQHIFHNITRKCGTLEKKIMLGTSHGHHHRGRPRMSWLDNITLQRYDMT